jgi:DNA-binding beta-propeller fold protein YncE
MWPSARPHGTSTTNPDGNLYVVTQTNDAIYRVSENGTGATLLYAYGVTTVNPTAIASLPNGNLLVANSGNDSIDLFTPSGTLIQASFIRNTFTTDVSDILVVEGQ